VLPLSTISGRVTGPEGLTLGDVVIRLLPGSRYTTTAQDGSFHFYNVREGDFELTVDATTLPQGAELKPPSSVKTAVRIGTTTPPVEFNCIVTNTQKPIRKVLDRK
jgi:hypothetical protein